MGGMWVAGGRHGNDGTQPPHRPQRVQRVQLGQHVASGGQVGQGGATYAPATHGEACACGREGGWEGLRLEGGGYWDEYMRVEVHGECGSMAVWVMYADMEDDSRGC